MRKYRKELIYRCVECLMSESCFECKYVDEYCKGIEHLVANCLAEMNNKEQNKIISLCMNILKREEK